MDHVDHVHPVEDLVPLEQVQEMVLSRCSRLGLDELPLAAALGAVLASEVVVDEPIPPFANTAMDGYAVRSVDVASAPVELRVVGVLPAGAPPPTEPLGAGETWQIMTGAPMPPGADAVAIVERTERVGEGRVRVLDSAGPGLNVRPAGSDYATGAVAVDAGTLLTPAHLGVLASVGRSTVSTWRRPVVGVMSTGDELVDAGVPLHPGQIRESNRMTLGAFVRHAGFPVLDLGTVRDTEADLEAALEHAGEACDVVLSSGGVSKGEFDFVKVVLDRLATRAAGQGGESFELGVAIRPAKPLALAWLPRTGGAAPEVRPPVAFFGLPGNPVSAVVSFLVVALPAMRKMAGWPEPLPRRIPAVALDGLRPSSDGRLNLLRVTASAGPDGRLVVRSAGGQQSHQLSGLSSSNALAVVPAGVAVAVGDLVDVILFGPLV